MPSAHLTSEEQTLLAARVVQREPGAEDQLVRVFGARIRTMMIVRTRDTATADDLTQDTLLAALVALRAGRLRATDRLAAFVYGIARNVLNDHLRGRREVVPDVPLSPDLREAAAEDHLEAAEREAIVRKALDALGLDERRILLLTLVDGLKPGAIAEKLGLTPDVCRTRKTRALKKVVAEVERLSRSAPAGHHPGGADDV